MNFLFRHGREDDRMLAWRTTGEYWGKKRVVIVTYNPLTATRQRYSFEKKVLSLQAKWPGKIKVKDRTAVNLLASEFGQGESEVLVLAGLSLRFLNVPLFPGTGI